MGQVRHQPRCPFTSSEAVQSEAARIGQKPAPLLALRVCVLVVIRRHVTCNAARNAQFAAVRFCSLPLRLLLFSVILVKSLHDHVLLCSYDDINLLFQDSYKSLTFCIFLLDHFLLCQHIDDHDGVFRVFPRTSLRTYWFARPPAHFEDLDFITRQAYAVNDFASCFHAEVPQ